MKKLFILPALLCCSLLFANEDSGKAKSKKETRLAAKKEKAAKKQLQESNTKKEVDKGTPVVSYKNFTIDRRGSKQIVPVQ